MKPFHILCIFHKEKSPSLRIWPSGQFHCYGCGEEGRVTEHEKLFSTYERVRLPTDPPLQDSIPTQEELERAGQVRFPSF